jgi:hypothetical protein
MRRCSAIAIFVQKRLYDDFMLLKSIAGNLHGKKPKIHSCFHAADYLRLYLFARHGRSLTGESPEHAQIVGSV